MILSKLGIGIGARVVERLAARLIREGKIKRKAYQEGHKAGYAIGYAQAKKEMKR